MLYFNLSTFMFSLVIALVSTLTLIYMVLRYYLDSTKAITNEIRSSIIGSLPNESLIQDYKFVGFFHPYATIGGGGERVLWTAIKALQESSRKVIPVLYTAHKDHENKALILAEVKKKFRLEIQPEYIVIIRLYNIHHVDKQYPRLRLLMQSLGSMMLCFEAMSKFIPDLYIDTVGYSFTYPIVKLMYGVKVASYTHYPTISSDMYQVVASRESGINNDATVQNSPLLSLLKTMYYRLFFAIYSMFGSFCDSVMTNSSWTYNHIKATFKRAKSITVVYPPCDTEHLSTFPIENRNLSIVSLAQFRPEKNHALQIEAFAKLLTSHPEWRKSTDNDKDGYAKLIMIGGVRDASDQARADKLKELAIRLKVQEQVEIVTNAPYSFICEQLAIATVGIHSMQDEHFGINIVEFMAAGLVPIAHNSAGPKMDIVVPAVLPEDAKTINSSLVSMLLEDARKDSKLTDSTDEKLKDFPVGFLASSSNEFAQAMESIFNLDKHVLQAIQSMARNRAVNTFSEERFKSGFLRAVDFAIRSN